MSEKLAVGMSVEINPREDKTREKRVPGVIAEILTQNQDHPHGVLVKLKSGETGRVKKIIDTHAPSEYLTVSNNSIESAHIKFSDLIQHGENHRVEFKDRALWSATFTNEDIKNHRPQTKELHAYGKSTSKIIIAKILASFLNSNGGTLIIGVKENKDAGDDIVVGVEQEYEKLKDPCQDGYRRMIVDLIKDYFPSYIFNHLEQYFQIDFERIEEKNICGITSIKSDKRVFLKLKDTDHFFIRTDASTRELHGEEIVDYCSKRFIQ